MKEYKGIVIALIAGVCAIICVSVFSFSIVNYKRTSGSGGLTATGSANCDFEADLIVWRGEFSSSGLTSRNAYQEMVFSSVTISERWTTLYNDEGNRTGEVLDGYDLSQSISITSMDVDKIEAISRDISELIESDVEFISYEPEYYYTKLDELKLELIEQATQNAKDRIDLMAAGSGTKPGELLNATLGVFQITPQNSNTEYSYGGTFDTSSRLKNASVTVKLNYTTQ